MKKLNLKKKVIKKKDDIDKDIISLKKEIELENLLKIREESKKQKICEKIDGMFDITLELSNVLFGILVIICLVLMAIFIIGYPIYILLNI